ncbi:riboflavin synthase subunit alpha [Pseudoalteromonas sp. T1lg76]|uniref:riboflavin synthase subunit alpha n=1 Tax=Pseudoalteromonas sp. T1lg76 TaxID=2077103 RepID=UPI000CF70B84|nr:riboflavin synthase subunit alpha [Pseudoalteromonas sp. T1lg76]
MFTGIVQCQAQVQSKTLTNGVQRLVLAVPSKYLQNLELGASIAVNGCCLTVVEYHADAGALGSVQFDVIDETLALTNLGLLECGDKVNFERSMTFGSELGGHIVSGHIHCVGSLIERIDTQDNCRMHIAMDAKWREYVLYKGFISVNGASLTVGELSEQGFWLHLIPETLAITNLGQMVAGAEINIEVDQQTYTIVQTVQRYLKQQH